MAVLVLQAFAEHGGAAGGASHQEAFAARDRRRLQASMALVRWKPNMQVVHRKTALRHSVVGVGRTMAARAGHGAGLGDDFFEDLAVLHLHGGSAPCRRHGARTSLAFGRVDTFA